MSDDNVVNLNDFKNKKEPEKKLSQSINYEFHFYTNDDGASDDVVPATGYLKFGPQFIAVLDSPQDDGTVIFACSTAAVKYIKQLGQSSEVQATLNL